MYKLMKKVAADLEAEQGRKIFVRGIEGKDMLLRWRGLRDFYSHAREQIASAGRNEWGIDPYEVDWKAVFTPIENALWHDIRAAGLVLYPQFPVGRFFVDFGNPAAKVAIECDGAKWHIDKAKDAARDASLRAMGWSVYRVTGVCCKTDGIDECGEKSEARKLLDRIGVEHGIARK